MTSRTRCDLVITHGYVITMNPAREIYRDGAIAVQGSRIAMVGSTKNVTAAFEGRATIDAAGSPVHPGFIDGHYHVTNQITRGVFPDMPSTKDYYVYYARWYDRMRSEDEQAATQLAGLEMLRAGITCFVEPGTVFDTAAVAEAVHAVGIRASLGEPFLWDTGEDATLSNMERVRPDPQRCQRLMGQELWRNEDPAALVRGHVCLYGHGTATDKTLLMATELAASRAVMFTEHQSANAAASAAYAQTLGQEPLVHFAKIGALKPHCAYTHMNALSSAESEAVRRSGMSVIWCPANSMNWGVGATGAARPHPALHAAGVNLAFGSDTPKWGFDTSPMVAYLLARDEQSAPPLTPEDVFEMATLGGARALCMEADLGSLEPGKRADIVIRSAEVEFQPGFSPIQNLLLASRGRSVDAVIVDGRLVMRSGRSTRLDHETVYARARAAAQRLAHEIGLAFVTTWPEVDK